MGSAFGRRNTAEDPGAAASLDARLLNQVDRAFAAAADRADRAIRAAPARSDIGARFEIGLQAVLEAAAAHPDSTRLCLIEAPGLGAKAVERKEAGLQRFVDLLDRELAAGHGGSVPPLVSEMIVGGIYEVAQRSVRAGDVADLPALTGQLTELWLPALQAR